jgi:hypothetical protein
VASNASVKVITSRRRLDAMKVRVGRPRLGK